MKRSCIAEDGWDVYGPRQPIVAASQTCALLERRHFLRASRWDGFDGW